MEVQQKSFDDLLREDRLKRLERQLKLNNIKGGAGSPQLTASPHMSISSLSSIHGDNGALSDFSFSGIPSNFSSRAGSVVVASSINLRTELLKNLKKKKKIMPTTSSEIDHRSDVDNIDKDRKMMPPPSLRNISPNYMLKSSPAQQRCGDSGDKQRVDNVNGEEIGKETGKNCNSNSKQRGIRVFRNWIVRLNDTGQIIIKGKLESGELARSKAVKKRINAMTLISVLNHQYHIVGDIYDLREELPEYVRGKFYNGFPTDWENVRQIWQCYVASGSSSRFRWPRPVADSDDDIRSDITELTTPCSTRNSVSKTSVDANRDCQPLGKETSVNNAMRNADSKREKTAMDSDISCIKSAMEEEEEDFHSKVKTSNSVKRTIEEGENPSNNCQVKSSNAGAGCSNCGNLIPKRKIDIIVDNMMNKNCSMEYIDRVLKAINCLNDLLVILPTKMTNNVETAPDEGVSMNYNSNTQYESMGNVVKPKALRDKAGSTEGRKNQANISHSNSYSPESSDESEQESPTKRDAFIREESTRLRIKQNDSQSKSLHQLPQSLSRSPTLGKQLAGRFVGDNPKRGENKKIAGVYSAGEEMANKFRNRVDNRRKKSVCSTSISGMEALATSEASPGNSSFVAINSDIEAQTRSVLLERMSQVKATPNKNYDSDISIIDRCPTLNTKSKTLIEEEVGTVFTDAKNGNNNRADSRTTNARSNEKISNSSPLACMIRLNKITTEQNNISRNECRTPSKSATPTRKKSRNDVSQQSNDSLISNLENVNMRMSSRGRRILPPLHFWKGERLVCRDKEVLYTSGARRTSSISSDILQQSVSRNDFASTSQLASKNMSDGNLDKASKEQNDLSKPATDQNTRHLRRGRVLSEIPNNNESINDYATTSEKRYSTRSAGDKFGKPRKPAKYVVTSSSEEETNICTAMPRRKKRRIY